jgi:hypothetical protein
MKRALLFATWGICLLLPLEIFAQESGSEIETSNHVVTWVRKNLHGKPTSLGVRFPASNLHNLPDESFEIVARFPHVAHLPFTHLYLVWEPHGHEPPGVYDVPHFDVHFYILPDSERRQITCTGADEAKCLKSPPAAAVAANYIPTPAGVPMMGWHWLDALAPELHGQPFTSTMIYGYYNGRLAFYEPMITLDFLRSHPHFADSIRQPQEFSKPGYYPKAYQVVYRSVTDSLEVALTNLVYRH